MSFKDLADVIIALHDYQFKGILDSRLVKTQNGIALKATGNSEISTSPSDGGYLVGGEVISPLLHAISQKSSLFSKASKFYSSGPNVNTAYLPFVNEAHRTDSAFQMKSYWIGEGADKTRAKFTLGLAECKLGKVYCNVAFTEELWSDSAMFRSALEKFISDPSEGSLIWKVDRGILLGTGAADNGMYGIFGPSSNGTIGVAQADPLDEATLNAFNDALAPATHKTSEWYMSEENYIELQAINFTNENDKYYKDGDLYIYGKKVNVVEQMVTPYDLMLGDVQQYAIALKAGNLVESASTIHILFNTDELSIRFGIRINGKSFGSAYDLDDGSSVGTFVIPATSPAEESSSSSSVDSSSSSSSSNSSSSNSSTSSVDSHSSDSSSSLSSISSESSSSHSQSSESSSSHSQSSASSESSSSHSNSSDSSSTNSSSQSSGWVGACEEYYTASSFDTDTTLNGRYDVAGRINGKAYYRNATATRYIFWSSTFNCFAIAASVGAAPTSWLSSNDATTDCAAGTYENVAGVVV